MIKSLALSLLTLGASAIIEQGDCELYNDPGSNVLAEIDAYASVTFGFKPLFPSDPKLVFAVDGIPSPGDGTAPGTARFGSWLEYDEKVLTGSDRMVTQMDLMYLPGDPTPGGGNNGCDGVWGSECSGAFRKKMLERLASLDPDSEDGVFNKTFFGQAVEGLNFSGPDDGGCSQFPELTPLGLIHDGQLAIETPDKQSVVPSGGSDSSLLTGVCPNATIKRILDWTFVGLVARLPDPATTNLNETSPEDVQFQFACMTPVAGAGPGVSRAAGRAKYDPRMAFLVVGLTTMLGFWCF